MQKTDFNYACAIILLLFTPKIHIQYEKLKKKLTLKKIMRRRRKSKYKNLNG